MRELFKRLPLLAPICFVATVALHAQDISSLTGIVTDASGAVIPGATITLVDTKTNTTYTAKASKSGDFDITAIKPGPGYKITFSSAGFQDFVVANLDVPVARTLTQNARLNAGSTTTSVEVSADNKNATIDTVDATIGNNIDVKLLNNLPILTRDSPQSLFTLQPGVVVGSVTGARTDQSETTVDGLDVNDVAAGQATTFAIQGRAPVDSLQEFRGTVAGQLASNGPGGGGQFQLITKSGTNRFHGDLNEYHRDAQLQANAWFNDNAVTGGVSTPIRKAPFIQNQFGGNLGGPILHDRAFFFFNFYESRIIQYATTTITVPNDQFRAGMLSYINNGAGCTTASRLDTTPACVTTLTAAQVAAIDPLGIGQNIPVQTFINNRYPRANDLTLGNGLNTAGYRFNGALPANQTNYVAKLDYDLTKTQHVFVRGTMNRQNSTQSVNRLPTDPVSNPFIDRSYSYVGSHVWQIGSNKVNQFSYGDTITRYNFPSTFDPTGTTQLAFSGLTNPYNSFSTQTRRVPIPEFRDDFNWNLGSHSLSFGGTFKFIKTHSLLLNDFNNPTIGLGGNTPSLVTSLRPANILNATASNAAWDSAFTLDLGRVAAISSNYNYDNTGKQTPQGAGATRHYRYYQTEVYAGDTWKATKELTLTYGVRYQYYSVPYETTGLQSEQNLSFNQLFSARVAQSAAQQSGNTSVPLLTYVLGGKANNGPSVYQPNYKDFAPRFAFNYAPKSGGQRMVFNGSAALVFDRTVINAVNFIQDQSSYLFQQTGVVNNFGVANDPVTSLKTDPRLGSAFTSTNPVLPVPFPAPPAIVNPFQPNVSATGALTGLSSGRGQNAVDPNLKDPYNITYNAGVQQELPGNFVMRLNYVGRLGRRLLAQADASQIIDYVDPATNQSLVTAFRNLTIQSRAGVPTSSSSAVHTVTPQPFFESQSGLTSGNATQALYNAYNSAYVSIGDLTDFLRGASTAGYIKPNVGMSSQLAYDSYLTNKGFSSYNGLLFTLSKNLNRGLQFDVNYTWSHSIDNTSLVANAIAANTGLGFICDVTRPRECRGNSDFDVQNVVNSDFFYDLPVGRGRTFLSNSPKFVDELIGGWQVSGIPTWRSGVAFTPVTGAFIAGFASNSPALLVGAKGYNTSSKPHKLSNGSVNLFNNGPSTGAITAGNPAGLFQNPLGLDLGSRNNLRGPSAVTFDAGLAKTFSILADDRLNAKFRADGFNILNHPVFSTPSVTNINSGTFGQITTVAVAARVLQVSLRLEF